MDYRRWCWFAEWVLVVVVAGLHGLIFWMPEDIGPPNLILMVAHDAQAVAAVVLVLAWAVLGPGSLKVRLLAVPMLFGLWFLPWQGRIALDQIAEPFVVVAFCSAVLLVMVRVLGWRATLGEQCGAPQRGGQYSLLSLLAATTVIAAVVGILEALRPVVGGGPGVEQQFGLGQSSSRIGADVRMLIIGAAAALSGLGGIWTVLRPGSIWLRLGVLTVLLPVSGLYLVHLAGSGDAMFNDSMSMAIGLAAVAGLCGVSVLPLRVMGFRIERQNREAGIVRHRAHSTLACASG